MTFAFNPPLQCRMNLFKWKQSPINNSSSSHNKPIYFASINNLVMAVVVVVKRSARLPSTPTILVWIPQKIIVSIELKFLEKNKKLLVRFYKPSSLNLPILSYSNLNIPSYLNLPIWRFEFSKLGNFILLLCLQSFYSKLWCNFKMQKVNITIGTKTIDLKQH